MKPRKTYLLILPVLFYWSSMAINPPNPEKKKLDIKGTLILNIAADALVLRPDWGSNINKTDHEPELKASQSFYNDLSEEIRKLSKEQTIKSLHNYVDTMRGFSASVYSRGADAIHYFNSFIPFYSRKIVDKNGSIQLCDDGSQILKEAGELSTSVNKPRSHLFTYNDPEIKQVPGQVQMIVQDHKSVYNIHTGPKPVRGTYIVRIGMDDPEGFKNARFEVKVNDVVCRQIEDMSGDPAYKYDNTRKWEFVTNVSETGARVMQFSADLHSVKNGYNQISIVNLQPDVQSVTWLEVHIE